MKTSAEITGPSRNLRKSYSAPPKEARDGKLERAGAFESPAEMLMRIEDLGIPGRSLNEKYGIGGGMTKFDPLFGVKAATIGLEPVSLQVGGTEAGPARIPR